MIGYGEVNELPTDKATIRDLKIIIWEREHKLPNPKDFLIF